MEPKLPRFRASKTVTNEVPFLSEWRAPAGAQSAAAQAQAAAGRLSLLARRVFDLSPVSLALVGATGVAAASFLAFSAYDWVVAGWRENVTYEGRAPDSTATLAATDAASNPVDPAKAARWAREAEEGRKILAEKERDRERALQEARAAKQATKSESVASR